MDEQPEPIPPKSRGKRALELLPELLECIERAYTGLCKDTSKVKAFEDAKALLAEK